MPSSGPATLLDLCVSSILTSLYLLSRACVHLPKHLVHYLLYEAMERNDALAVEKLIETWSHEELSLDFIHTNSLVMKKRLASPSCLSGSEYYGTFRLLSSHCGKFEHAHKVAPILMGLFQNVLHCRGKPVLKKVDVSSLLLGAEREEYEMVRCLALLLRGECPYPSPSDYYVWERKVKHKKPRATLSKPQKCDRQHQITIYASVVLRSEFTKELIDACKQGHPWFQLCLVGLDLSSQHLSEYSVILALSELNLTQLQELRLWTCSYFPVHKKAPLSLLIPHPFTLWLVVGGDQRRLFHGFEFAHVFYKLKYLKGVFFQLLRYEEYCMRGLYQAESLCNVPVFSIRSEIHGDTLKKCLQHRLQFLELNTRNLRCIPLDSIVFYSQLRVLSVTDILKNGALDTQTKCTTLELINAIGSLAHLEFLEWSDGVNLRTSDLLGLYHLFTSSLPSLSHWHMQFPSLLLSTTDLDNSKFSPLLPVLEPLLSGKEGDKACTTYKFPNKSVGLTEWLSLVRPDVCFRMEIHPMRNQKFATQYNRM